MTWVIKRIADLGRVITGKTPATGNPEFFDGDYPFVTPSDIDYANYYCQKTERTVTDSARERHANQFVPKDAVMFTCIGNTIGKCAIAISDSLTNQQINSVVANKCTDAKFIYYLLCNNVASIRPLGGGSATPIINKTDFESIGFRVPPHDAQKQIGEFLSAYDDLIENNRRRMALLEESARLLYREWFVRLRFPGYEHTRLTNGVPEGWERVPLEDVLLLQRGFDLPSQARQKGEVPIYGSTGVLGYHNSAKASAPGIVTGRSGTLGDVQYVAEDYWPLNTALWVKEFKKVPPLFALFLLREMDLKQYNGGSSVPTLDRKTVHKVEILLPSWLLLSSFDEFAAGIFTQIKNLNFQNQKLRTARDLLLPRLMSGEITV